MSPTMVHHDETRDLVFVWHGDTAIHVYRADDHAHHAPPFDAINVWDEHEDAPAICDLGGLRCEADAYVAFFEADRAAA